MAIVHAQFPPFAQFKGLITCQVNGSRRYSHDLPQGGLEIPCVLTFRMPKQAPQSEKTKDKTERLINNALSKHYDINLPIPKALRKV